MEASERSEVQRETDHAPGRRVDPVVDAVRQEYCRAERSPPRNSVWPSAKADVAFETFIDGSGI